MEPQIVERPAFTVIGMKYRGRNEHNEIPGLWEQFVPRMGEVPRSGAAAYGVMGNYDPATGEFDYVAGLEGDPSAAVPEGMVRWDVPAGTYAAFRCSLNTVRQTLDDIYHTWLPGSGHEHADAPEFEYYGADYDPEDRDSPMYVYIPIEPGNQ
jgi:AraC family transcriptional regulator